MRTYALLLTIWLTSALSSAQVRATTPKRPGWTKEPGNFRGMRWGASEDEVSKGVPGVDCGPHGDYVDRCIGQFDIGPNGATNVFTFSAEKRLESVLLSFDSKDFDAMKTILIERYGPPTRRAVSEVKTRMNASYQNETLQWLGTKVDLTAMKYGSDITSGFAHFETKAAAAKHAKAADAKAKADAQKF